MILEPFELALNNGWVGGGGRRVVISSTTKGATRRAVVKRPLTSLWSVNWMDSGESTTDSINGTKPRFFLIIHRGRRRRVRGGNEGHFRFQSTNEYLEHLFTQGAYFWEGNVCVCGGGFEGHLFLPHARKKRTPRSASSVTFLVLFVNAREKERHTGLMGETSNKLLLFTSDNSPTHWPLTFEG